MPATKLPSRGRPATAATVSGATSRGCSSKRRDRPDDDVRVVDEELAAAGVARAGLKQLDEVGAEVVIRLEQERRVGRRGELDVQVAGRRGAKLPIAS